MALGIYLDNRRKRAAKAAGLSFVLDHEASHTFLKLASNSTLQQERDLAVNKYIKLQKEEEELYEDYKERARSYHELNEKHGTLRLQCRDLRDQVKHWKETYNTLKEELEDVRVRREWIHMREDTNEGLTPEDLRAE